MIYVIINGDEPLSYVEQVIEWRPDWIQFRNKGNWQLSHAKTIFQKCKAKKIPLIINDRVDVAMEIDADGVHLGQDDLPIPVARELLGEKKMIGGTASNLEQALRVQKEGANYVGLGHIFKTPSKEKLYPPIGLKTLKQVTTHIEIPVIAIGGINETNWKSVVQHGASGIAILSSARVGKWWH